MKDTQNLVSVIIPTRNSATFLNKCLNSVKDQTYPQIEIIVVDNNSSDTTINIAKKYTSNIYTYGSERSEQVNYGVSKSSGEYVYKVDSDFVLDRNVVEQCLQKINEGCDAVVVHNSPDETISWISKIRKFEVDMYKYDITHSSARFLRKKVYTAIGGFNVNVTAGEDYDFQNKLNRGNYKTGFIDAEALHKGEPQHIIPHLMKMFAYGKDFVNYQKANKFEATRQLGVRYIFIKKYKNFIKHPIQGGKLLLYFSLKYIFGGAGYLYGKMQFQREQ